MQSSDYAARFTRNVLLPIADNYFRASISVDKSFLACVGQRPIILLGNHAGRTLSWDNILFDALLLRETTELGQPVKLQRLVHSGLYNSQVLPYLIPDWWKLMECHESTMDNFSALCARNAVVFVSPEGLAGIMKDYSQRGILQPFSSSFIYMAKKYNALLVPVTIANTEYFHPFARTIRKVNTLATRLFGLPFLPLSLFTLLTSMPKCISMAVPARIKYHVHAPITIEDTENSLQGNRQQAEAVRQRMQDIIAAENDTLFESVDIGHLLRSLFSRKPGGNALRFYREFWSQHLQRDLRAYERAMFSMPFLGYFLIARAIRKGQLLGATSAAPLATADMDL
jgi:hypothetical protein